MKLELPASIVTLAPAQLIAIGKTEVAQLIETRIKRFGNPNGMEINVADLGEDGLEVLRTLAQQEGERGLMMQITSYKNIISNPFKAKIGNLKSLAAGLMAFILKDAIDGWLYHQEDDGIFIPWLVRNIQFAAATQNMPSHVVVQLSANTAKNAGKQRDRDICFSKIIFFMDDIAKMSIPELLAKESYFHETPALKEAYEADLAAFGRYRPQYGAQFVATGLVLNSEDGYRQKAIPIAAGTKMVNDEESITRYIIEHVDNSFWANDSGKAIFDMQPYHCRLFMFNLGLHVHQWVHVSTMTPYEYRPELREKLILPDLHRDLIDILTTDMDVIMEDIVDGKSGGTTILCKGAPGLGKTLTAEVYSEVVKKPLYRVHSGQLGTDAKSVEEALGVVLKRAARWGAVLLIDEADVFVRRRDNDVQHNAVVAAFLRTLEYFSGLLFMTTNRADDIDDAILSRCIAIIKYEHPSKNDAKRIWKVLADQFDIEMAASLISELVDLFPEASGRDIKELLKLTSKFSRRKAIPLDTEAFRQCAMFRGVL
jgi:hypothetical protein